MRFECESGVVSWHVPSMIDLFVYVPCPFGRATAACGGGVRARGLQGVLSAPPTRLGKNVRGA